MKVIAFNGSPHPNGNTYHALNLVCNELEKEGIETKVVTVGNKMIGGCLACNKCIKNKNEKCINDNDKVNNWIQMIKEADGILLGAPVHYASIPGNMKSFLDRAFYVAGMNNSLFRHKVGASIVAVRRTGGMPAFNELNNFLNYSEMLLPTSNYWNVIHGTSPGEILQDLEGVQTLQILGKNMAYLLKLIDNTKGKIIPPKTERKTVMNFIR